MGSSPSQEKADGTRTKEPEFDPTPEEHNDKTSSSAATSPSTSEAPAEDDEFAIVEKDGEDDEEARKPKKSLSLGFRLIGKVLKVGDAHSDLSDLEELASMYLSDISFSDLTSGLLLLSRYYLPKHPHSHSRIPLAELKEVRHFMRIAAAVYGWKLLAAWTGQGVGTAMSTVIAGSKDKEIETNTRWFKRHIGLEDKDIDILTADWFSHHLNPAHVLFADHTRQEVVLAIRGTMDLHDVFSDLIATKESFAGTRVHRGMFLCATNKYAKLKPAILEAITVKYPQYKFIVTGHSLGAGTASLLCMMLQQDYPSIQFHCYGYGTPAVVEPSFAPTMSSWMTTVVHRCDVIPRLSEGSIYDLKDRVKYALERNSAWTKRFAHILAGNNSFGKTFSTKVNEKYGDANLDENEIKLLNTHEKLITPGRVIYLYRNEKDPRLFECELAATNNIFSEIVLYPTFFSDHLPDLYDNVLGRTLQRAMEVDEAAKAAANPAPLTSAGTDSSAQLVPAPSQPNDVIIDRVDSITAKEMEEVLALSGDQLPIRRKEKEAKEGEESSEEENGSLARKQLAELEYRSSPLFAQPSPAARDADAQPLLSSDQLPQQ